VLDSSLELLVINDACLKRLDPRLIFQAIRDPCANVETVSAEHLEVDRTGAASPSTSVTVAAHWGVIPL
jgi:hypothetical protein